MGPAQYLTGGSRQMSQYCSPASRTPCRPPPRSSPAPLQPPPGGAQGTSKQVASTPLSYHQSNPPPARHNSPVSCPDQGRLPPSDWYKVLAIKGIAVITSQKLANRGNTSPERSLRGAYFSAPGAWSVEVSAERFGVSLVYWLGVCGCARRWVLAGTMASSGSRSPRSPVWRWRHTLPTTGRACRHMAPP